MPTAEAYVLCSQTYDATEGDTLAKKYDKLNWRIISKPGGATVRPDDFYNLYGYAMVLCIMCASTQLT